MKQTIRLNENELRSLIAECVMQTLNEEQKEGFFGNIGRAMGNAFGGDASKMRDKARHFGSAVKDKAQQAGSAIKSGVQQAGQAIQNKAQQAGNAVKQGAQNVATGAQQRYQAAKAGYQTGQKNDKINKLISDIQDLQNSGILTGRATNQAINVLMSNLKQAMGRNNAEASAYKNQIGKPEINEEVVRQIMKEVLSKLQ